MPLAIPPELKKITQFVRRAEELDRDKTSPESRLVAYYCRQYAVHAGIPLASSSPASKQCLSGLLAQLEKEKPAMDNFTRDEAAFLCRKFATAVFDRADEEDRNGLASKNTAKNFYAAASFLQVLEQFEEEGSDQALEDKEKVIYAKWKATEILKAIKEGRTPTPGGYGEDAGGHQLDEDGDDGELGEKRDNRATGSQENSNNLNTIVAEDEPDVDVYVPMAANIKHSPSIPPPMSPADDSDKEGETGLEVELDPPPAYPWNSVASTTEDRSSGHVTHNLPSPPAETVSQKPSGGGFFGFGKKKGGKVTKNQLIDATELTRFALAALEDKDDDLAAERLQQALAALGR